MTTTRRSIVAVIGDGAVTEDDPRHAIARDLGRLLVDGGARVLCGGLGGVMEAAARGAHESARYHEGDTLGLLPGFDPAAANPWIDIAIPTGLGHLRNGLVAAAGAVIAVGGGAGTLSEMAFAWMHGRPVVALDCEGWSGQLGGRALDDKRASDHPAGSTILRASTAADAVRLALAHTR